jgi:hypothetical protein
MEDSKVSFCNEATAQIPPPLCVLYIQRIEYGLFKQTMTILHGKIC